MVDRIRTEFQRVMTGEGGGARMSQAELDAYRRQLVMLAVAGVTILVVLILGIGAFYQYVYLPRQAVAEVGGQTITRSDYWDYRKYQLLMQINQYQQIGQMMEGEQAQQYQQLALQADQEFQNIEDADVDPMTLDEMITNRIVLDSLDEFNIEITDQEIDDYLVEYFSGTPVGEETPGPDADPTAEAWATATAEAQQEEAEAQQEEAESQATPEGEQTEGEDGAESDDGTDQGDGDQSDENSGDGAEDDAAEADESTPTPQPTPADEEIRATAEANQSNHEEFLLDRADLSHDEFVDMIIRPELAQEKIRDRLAEDVPVRAEQVQAAHILVATEDAASQIYEDLTGDDARDFAEVAEEESTDSQTAPNGGELGWFPRDVMVPAFDEVVFDLEAGEISEPFETEFGWHIATVLDRAEDRPIPLQVLQQLRQQAFDDWLQEQRESTDIDTGDVDLPDDTGTAPGQFQPPAGAPQPPQPQPQPQPEMQGPEDDAESGDDGESEDIFEGDDPFEDAESDSDED